jgi:hypothetical protein
MELFLMAIKCLNVLDAELMIMKSILRNQKEYKNIIYKLLYI